MPKYNAQIHHRRSIRLKGYDYSQAGLYFITICVQNKLLLFGNIVNGKLESNDAGKMIIKWWYELKNKYKNIELHEHVVMPNHFHGIIQIVSNVGTVGADLCVCPKITDTNQQTYHNKIDANQCKNPNKINEYNNKQTKINSDERNDIKLGECNYIKKGEHKNKKQGEHNNIKKGEHIGSPLHAMVQWFKTMTTNEYIRNVKQNNWPRFNGKLWQRNYWEHIIRNEKSYSNIANYIRNNPVKWQDDRYHN